MTPPARLVRQHERDLTTVLVVGGSPRRRLEVAFEFHRRGRNRRGAFVCMTGAHEAPRLCGALRAWLFSSGSRADAGPVAAAVGGTLFVDGLGSLEPEAQRLLRLFIERCVNVPGGVDAWRGRLVVGTSAGIARALARGRVACDLFDLIDKVRVDLPPRGGRVVAMVGSEGGGA